MTLNLPMTAVHKRTLTLILGAVIVVTLALTLFLLFAPSAAAFSADGLSASVSRTRLPLAGSCFDLTFESAGAVTLDGSPVEGAQRLCSWRIHTYELSNDTATLQIPITVVTGTPLFWLIAMTPLFLLIALIQWHLPALFAHLQAALDVGGRITRRETITVLIAFTALVILLWIPYGVLSNANRDNWELRGWIESGVFPPLLTAPMSPERAFNYLYEWVAFLISGETFIGYNLILILDLIFKGALTWLLMRRLFPRQRVIAWSTALIFVLHPTDPFALYALNVQQAVLGLLITAHLLLSYWRQPSIMRFGIAHVAAMITCVLYDSVMPMVVLLPFLLLLDTPRLSRRWLAVAALWASLPLLWIAYFVVWVLASPSDYFVMYQEGRATLLETLRTIAQIYINTLPGAYLREVRSLLLAIRTMNARLIYGAVAFVVALIVGWRLSRSTEAPTLRRAAALVIMGIAAIFVGMAMYIPAGQFRTYVYGGTHSYYVATLGAALASAGLLALLPRRVQVIGVALIAGMSVINLVGAHGASQEANAEAARSLAAVVATVPHVEPGTSLLIMDESPRLALNTPLVNASLDSGLRVIYGTGAVHARLCNPNVTTYYTCSFTPQGADVSGYEVSRDVAPFNFYRGERELVPYNQLVILRYDGAALRVLTELPPEWGIETDAYQPLRRVNLDAPLPPRYDSMLVPALRFVTPLPLGNS